MIRQAPGPASWFQRTPDYMRRLQNDWFHASHVMYGLPISQIPEGCEKLAMLSEVATVCTHRMTFLRFVTGDVIRRGYA